MHPLRLPHAPCSVPSTGLASSAHSTANLGLGSSVSFGGVTACQPALSSLQANPLLSSGNNSEPGIGVLRVRVGPNAFSKGKPAWTIDDSLSTSGILSAPVAQPSPIP